jgi:hypothetical protein
MVNGVVDPNAICAVSGTGNSYLLLDLATFTTGTYSFVVTLIDAQGWRSEPTNPFVANKLGPGGVALTYNP